ncbi:MAG: TlpA disulfide reductase family protein [Bacteroidales bacterium]|jgi:peroxiredoxin|nr:TlpA disulfide reductase family protein [Bacteroidales bacterium]
MKKIFYFAIVIFTINSCNSNNDSDKSELKDIKNNTLIEVGQMAPDFSFVSNNGDSINISDFKGKIVFVNFFATSCPICMKEMPYLEKDIYEKFKDEDFVLLSFGRGHSVEDIEKFYQKWEYGFSISPDSERDIYSLFANKYIPRNIILDKTGKIIFQKTGFDQKDINKITELIIEELNN